MRIELILTGASASEDDARHLGDVVIMAAKAVGVPVESIHEVIVATEDRFADVVGRFDPTKLYTNSRGLVAAGKLFTNRKADPVTHSILLQYSVFDGILHGPKKHGSDYHLWPGEAQRDLYVVYHELGHCRDARDRPDNSDDGTLRNDAGQRVVDGQYSNICKYHHDMLLDELAACVNSGMAFTEKTRELDCRMNNEFVANQLEAIRQMTLMEPSELEKIRFEAIGLFWFILLQQAKHTGSWLGNAQLSGAAPEELWQIANAAKPVADTLRRADLAIQEAWKSYPNFTPEFRDEMTRCVNELADYCGFEFTRNGRDGVWWNLLEQFSVSQQLKLARAAV